ncbi:MAG: flavodoxin-dependent (E)-4-hydroxy-3-methylbut-2-enyl-diphosphate synthase [Bacilli bacterium]|jgi:(E)-4-hydroxy-3-methylbut-2-enyl-diphosphate synthase
MRTREKTKRIAIGNIHIGGANRVLIQSMCNIKTEKVDEVVAQINRCAKLGADMMRVSVLDERDASAIKAIKKGIHIPLIADIHFDYRLALLSIENGVDAIRINPGNIGDREKIKMVVDSCKTHGIPIRVGVNSGSLEKGLQNDDCKVRARQLVESARKNVVLLEELGFYDIVISIKGSDVIETVEAYRFAANEFPYPLHLGITEAGPSEIGIIRSVAGLSPLLIDGIGDTIRISLSDEPEEEIRTAKRLLHDIGLYPNYPTLISCPTCGRTQVNVVSLAKRVLCFLEDNNIDKTVAVMGCIVNGPGEAKHADIGLAGGKNQWVLFKKGKMVKTVDESQAFDELIKELKSH